MNHPMTSQHRKKSAPDLSEKAAFGGDNWSQRKTSSREEIGSIWNDCGINNEWSPLEAVLLHRPGEELVTDGDPDLIQMLAPVDIQKAQLEHDQLSQTYKEAGVKVYDVNPESFPSPNLMFMADLFFMTPEGAVLSRPASTVRAGEEVHVARRLADLEIPILKTIRGDATFEGADAMWIDKETVLVGLGHRTNQEGIKQLSSLLNEMDIKVITVDMPYGTMHLMGMLRLPDANLAIAWPKRTPHTAIMALKERGYQVAFLPDENEAIKGMALNFVVLGPRAILMPQNNPNTQKYFESLGIYCHTSPVNELSKAAGAIGCLTGILKRSH